MKPIFFTFITFLVFCNGYSQQNSDRSLLLIPEPNTVEIKEGKLQLDKNISFFIETKEWIGLKGILTSGFRSLGNCEVTQINTERVNILIQKSDNLDSLAYSININSQILIKAGSYQAATFAISSLLQLIEKENSKVIFPKVFIEDKPGNDYQGLLVDVARKPHSIETLKQIIDICFFYKIRFIQIHLNDDQSFTFPSTAYPKLATPGHSFTKKELIDLVGYANAKGVTLIPEFDLPGHSSAMRKAMPELFGSENLSAINLASPKVWEAIFTISSEMMEIFYPSPYFHIGADEAWLEPLSKLPEVKKYIQAKGYDDVHDIFLEYIVRMNDHVKDHGKQTLVWESFQDNGSKHISIPDDILVFAWETLYQHPQSLIDHGYDIINASWKPLYITPWMRWDQQAILDWNPAKWENHWKITPSYNGLQIDTSDAIIGTQMCSWEMPDKMEVAEIKYRLPALAAKTWDLWQGAPDNFYDRYQHLDIKLQKILFPCELVIIGTLHPNYQGVEWNKENYFNEEISLEIKPKNGQTIHYTLDRNIPTIKDKKLKGKIGFNKTTHFKAKVFDEDGNETGYLNKVFEYHPVQMEVKGNYSLPRDINISDKNIILKDSAVWISLSSPSDKVIRYSISGDILANSEIYSSPIKINSSTTFQAALTDAEGNLLGEKVKMRFYKLDKEETLTTNKAVLCSEEDQQYTAKKAVDGLVDRDNFWSADSGAPQWLTVDLDSTMDIGTIQVFTYWDDTRYYQYKIDVSTDNTNWENVVDFSDNKIVASSSGISHKIESQKVRYIRTTMLYNSANPGLHISEIRAYK